MKNKFLLLIHLMVTLTLAAVVPPVDQKVTDVAIAIEPLDSSQSAESLENRFSNTEFVGDVTKEAVSLTQSAESAESTELSDADNHVLKTSDTLHRRYHYPSYQNPQYYYRQPVANVYQNRLHQHPLVVRWLNGNRNQPLSSDDVDSILFDLTGYYDSGVDILT